MQTYVPERFSEGVRVLMLINRSHGNTNKGSKRWVNRIITTNTGEFYSAREKLVSQMHYLDDPGIRLYSSVNSRNFLRARLLFQHKQINLTDETAMSFYRDANASFVSCLMQPECKNEKLFLLDVDSHEQSEVWRFLHENLTVQVIHGYPTNKGHHYIVTPFDVRLCAGAKTFEVKKDALMLLNWIREDS